MKITQIELVLGTYSSGIIDMEKNINEKLKRMCEYGDKIIDVKLLSNNNFMIIYESEE